MNNIGTLVSELTSAALKSGFGYELTISGDQRSISMKLVSEESTEPSQPDYSPKPDGSHLIGWGYPKCNPEGVSVVKVEKHEDNENWFRAYGQHALFVTVDRYGKDIGRDSSWNLIPPSELNK